jgi:hypothetical protein
LVVTGIIGGIIGYLLKTYFEHYREKRKRRYTEFAEGLGELHALAAEVHSAFSSQSDTNKIFKSSEGYLLHFSKSTLPDSILNKFADLNSEIRSCYPVFKPEGLIPKVHLMLTGEVAKKQNEKWEREFEDKIERKRRGHEASSEIVRLLKEERNKII